MKSVLEGKAPLADIQPHIDQCLGCLACEPACPSGVHYRNIVTPFRAEHQPTRLPVQQTLISKTLPYPLRFKCATALGRLAARFKRFLPATLQPMLERMPAQLPRAASLPEFVPAEGEVRGTVVMLTGCVQRVLAPEINAKTARLLARQGFNVRIPKKQSCCGSLDWHQGRHTAAQKHLRKLTAQIPGDVDAIISNAAGCGSSIAEAEWILKGEDNEAAGITFAKKTAELSRFIHRRGIRALPGPPKLTRVAIQDACHLLNGQGIEHEPRALLKAIPNIEVVELISTGCCGSAGTFNIEHPTLAADLGRQKAQHILEAQVDVVVSGNIGCILQLRPYIEELGGPEIMHFAEFLESVS